MKKEFLHEQSELQSPRLILRRLNDSDVDAIHELRTIESVNEFIDRAPPKAKQDVQKWLDKINTTIDKGECYYWSIDKQQGDRLIGTICLWNFTKNNSRAEIGFELHPDYQRQGIMTEALETVLDFCASTLGLREVEAYANTLNIASRTLLEKTGFSVMEVGGIIQENSKINGRPFENAIYELLLD